MADKLWSPYNSQAVPDVPGLVDRLNKFSTFWNDRGIPTTPITGVWCEINSAHCFGKY
jgi:hypothetical protein